MDDGNVVTSSGASAGIDMSLYVIQRLYGEEAAIKLANPTKSGWHRDRTWDPFSELHGLAN